MENGSGSSFKLAYQIVNDKLKVVAKDVRGSIVDEIHKQTDNSNRRNDQKDEVLKDTTKFLEDPAKKPFLLNSYKYLAALNSQVVICNNTKLTFTGDNWKEDKVSEEELKQLKGEKFSIPLGEKFVLKKEDLNSSLKLYERTSDAEKIVQDLEVKELSQTLIRYPIYLAYQPRDQRVSVIKFANDGNISRTDGLSWSEKLSPFSSYQTLVTSKNSGETLVFRKQAGHLFPDPVITQVTVSFDDGNKRITGYEYSKAKALGNIIYYENVFVVPGNDKGSFGWIEETRDFGNQSRTEKRIFNSQKELIKMTLPRKSRQKVKTFLK